MRLTTRIVYAVALSSSLLLAQAPKTAAPQKSTTSAFYFLSLQSVADAIRGSARGLRSGALEKPTSSETERVAIRDEYVRLYDSLGQLQKNSGSYLEALGLYVSAVQTGSSTRERHDALVDQIVILKTNLKALSEAFEPLKLQLDLQSPDVSDMIEQYIRSRGAKANALGLIDTLSLTELKDLNGQVQKNQLLLTAAIKKTRDLIAAKYPELSGSR